MKVTQNGSQVFTPRLLTLIFNGRCDARKIMIRCHQFAAVTVAVVLKRR